MYIHIILSNPPKSHSGIERVHTQNNPPPSWKSKTNLPWASCRGLQHQSHQATWQALPDLLSTGRSLRVMGLGQRSKVEDPSNDFKSLSPFLLRLIIVTHDVWRRKYPWLLVGSCRFLIQVSSYGPMGFLQSDCSMTSPRPLSPWRPSCWRADRCPVKLQKHQGGFYRKRW